jgi:hypothetical protein
LGNKEFKEPVEIEKLKTYVFKNYGYTPTVRLSQKGLVIIANSSALASTIRLSLPAIKRELDINMPINIRIA